MANTIKQRVQIINGTGIALLVSILAGTVAFGIMPMVRDGKNSIQEAQNLTKQLKDLDALRLQIARTELDKSTHEKRLTEAESHLPNSNGMNQFVQELAHVAEDVGLQVDEVTPSKELKDVGAYKLMSVRLTGTGDWDTCYRFLTGLRGPNRKLIRLEKLVLDATRDKPSDRPTCQIVVDISTLIAR